MWAEVINKILSFLKETLPGLLAAFSFGRSLGNKKIHELESKLESTELKLDYKNNEAKIETKYSNMSDSDVIESVTKSKRK